MYYAHFVIARRVGGVRNGARTAKLPIAACVWRPISVRNSSVTFAHRATRTGDMTRMKCARTEWRTSSGRVREREDFAFVQCHRFTGLYILGNFQSGATRYSCCGAAGPLFASCADLRSIVRQSYVMCPHEIYLSMSWMVVGQAGSGSCPVDALKTSGRALKYLSDVRPFGRGFNAPARCRHELSGTEWRVLHTSHSCFGD